MSLLCRFFGHKFVRIKGFSCGLIKLECLRCGKIFAKECNGELFEWDHGFDTYERIHDMRMKKQSES